MSPICTFCLRGVLLFWSWYSKLMRSYVSVEWYCRLRYYLRFLKFNLVGISVNIWFRSISESISRLVILGIIIFSCQVSSRFSFSLLLLILVSSLFSLSLISCSVCTASSSSISFNICISSSLLLLSILGSSCSMVDSSSFNTVVFSIFSSSLLLCKLLSSTA